MLDRLPRRSPLPLLLSALAVLACTDSVSAQERAQVRGAVTRKLQHVDPSTGPAGTTVTVATDPNSMPYVTPVRLGVGMLRAGFETLAELETSLQGNFSVTVKLPDWVTAERSIRFVLFDFYFNPIAMSDAFHVTDAQGRVQREGKVAAGTAEGCLTLLDRDGDLYTLVGSPTPLRDADNVNLLATLEAPGTCGPQPTLRVIEARVRP